MASMRDIKRQITSVESTKKITRAMKMVAAAKLRKSQERAESAKPFFDKTKETLADITARIDDDLHPLLEKRDVKKVGYVFITGDRGLCGAYNSRVIKKVETGLKESDKDTALISIGKKGRDYFKNKVEIISEYIEIEDAPGFSTATNIANELVELYTEGILDEIHLVYTEFNSVVSQSVESMQLLPIEPPESGKVNDSEESYLYDPSAEEVLSAVLPQYLKNIIFGALIQSKASEFASRMTAMDSATDNAEDMIEKLKLSYNRARQAAITQELSEIVGGAEALE
ncbi:ATP synthase F1 subunit gamma [Orenia metallireducens]|uniref:ATP synthase gamma chain n=1 Tax=Orenia metallireducens TaxID=1413210 RepID=A0A1C0A674_9FIRM|nr:ATP synthase F1 subunit gamma [Orenia metallireducens]OCL25645.1 ATP synthase F1 subunit gamma [Orenia metallireducens]